jgi:hypothetical protein
MSLQPRATAKYIATKIWKASGLSTTSSKRTRVWQKLWRFYNSFNWQSLQDIKTWIWLVRKVIIHIPFPIVHQKAALMPFFLSNHMEDTVQTKFCDRLNLELKGHEVANHR